MGCWKQSHTKGLATLNFVSCGSEATDGIHYLIETSKGLFSDRNLTLKSIRQSVIANWLNEKKLPLEKVQLLVGHKWISSTAIYHQTSVDEQRELINGFHPLG